jgi:hypothetical protein
MKAPLSLCRASRVACGLACVLLTAQVASAQSVESELAAAERAYSEIDFAAVRRWAESALEYGSATPEQLARLHVLLGIATATAGEDALAKQHFIAALAIQPDLRLERTLSPKIRDPYLEAQGYWGTFPERLKLSAEAIDGATSITINLTDPAQLAAEVVVLFRAPGATEYSEIVLPNATAQRARLNEEFREQGFEYRVHACDRFGNLLAVVGTEAEPVQTRGVPRAVATPMYSPSEDPLDEPEAAPTPAGASAGSAWPPVLLGVAGLGAAGVGAYFHVRREVYARQWNGADCERPGSTRGEQCVAVNSARRRAEELALGFYVGAAVALTAGTVFLFTSSASNDSPSALACGAGFLSVGCSGHF